MIELFHNDNVMENRKSSKGNQLKWRGDNVWYKADYAGYEGLAEYMVSHLLQYSTIEKDSFILYDTEEILYENKKCFGCRSVNFLPEGWQLITLERLFQSVYGQSLHDSVYAITDLADRMRFLVDHIVQITGTLLFYRNQAAGGIYHHGAVQHVSILVHLLTCCPAESVDSLFGPHNFHRLNCGLLQHNLTLYIHEDTYTYVHV